MKKRSAHFLLLPELLYSPPNKAIINAYLENGYCVDIYSPGILPKTTAYGHCVETHNVMYSWIWLLKNIFRMRWLNYQVISGTSEDPLAVVGAIGLLFRKKTLSLVDEIKAGSYRGDRSDLWKKLCKIGIRYSRLRIVNDESRVDLLQDYAGLKSNDEILIYPGCFTHRPPRTDDRRSSHRRAWGFNDESFIIGSSGGFNLTAGADWLLESVRVKMDTYAVIQPIGVSPLCMFLLKNLEYADRIYIQDQRMEWIDAWDSAQGFDVGLCIYTNQSPQFQKMGISSNRLCMFIAMGVPVIASRQKSFEFLEAYGCGVLVSDYNEFVEAIEHIRTNKTRMLEKCEICFREYIRPGDRYNILSTRLKQLTDGV